MDLGQIRGYLVVLGVWATSTFATPDGFKIIYGNFRYNKMIFIFCFNFEKCQSVFLDLKLAVSASAFSFQPITVGNFRLH